MKPPLCNLSHLKEESVPQLETISRSFFSIFRIPRCSSLPRIPLCPVHGSVHRTGTPSSAHAGGASTAAGQPQHPQHHRPRAAHCRGGVQPAGGAGGGQLRADGLQSRQPRHRFARESLFALAMARSSRGPQALAALATGDRGHHGQPGAPALGARRRGLRPHPEGGRLPGHLVTGSGSHRASPLGGHHLEGADHHLRPVASRVRCRLSQQQWVSSGIIGILIKFQS